jgi:hypothetical protein
MNATLYTANGGTPQSITNGVAGQSFAPDFVWVKTRSVSNYHGLADSVRGVNKALFSNVTDAESTASSNYVTSFDTNGFSINQGGVFNGSSGTTMVAWQWKAGGTAVSNTSGTLTSSVSANTTSGFSIATFTAQSSGTGSVGHGLGATPSMLILKARNAVNGWPTYHSSVGINNYLLLNTSNSTQADSGSFTAVSSTTFTLGSSFANGNTYVAYCWTPIAGYSAFGSYVGNGSTDGPFIYTGFRPAFILTKDITTGSYWWEMVDSARSPYNTSNVALYANVADSEYTSSLYNKDLLSNGFKIRGISDAQNTSGSTYIYMAFAQNPFKYANAR